MLLNFLSIDKKIKTDRKIEKERERKKRRRKNDGYMKI